MATKEDLIDYFQGLTVPKQLLALWEFENNIAQNDYFCEGFELIFNKEKALLKTYSDSDIFLNSIYEFANADGSGSSYGLWRKDANTNLEQVPIVAFGSEGGYHVVASNLNEFLQLLTFDCEPMIDWKEIHYDKSTDHSTPSVKSKEYRDWLMNTHGLTPIENVKPIEEKAQSLFRDPFNIWMDQFIQS